MHFAIVKGASSNQRGLFIELPVCTVGDAIMFQVLAEGCHLFPDAQDAEPAIHTRRQHGVWSVGVPLESPDSAADVGFDDRPF